MKSFNMRICAYIPIFFIISVICIIGVNICGLIMYNNIYGFFQQIIDIELIIIIIGISLLGYAIIPPILINYKNDNIIEVNRLDIL